MKTLRDIGELAAISRILKHLPRRRDILCGAGDDCAVVRAAGGWDWLLTSDPVIEGVHFNADADRSAVGHKAIARVLSDIAAMGGEPLWALLDVVAAPAMPARDLDAIYRGLSRVARRHGLAVVGGDLSRGPRLEIHAFAVGRIRAGRAVLRSGARPGDRLYVTGALGGSLRGKHLRFEPRLRQGVWLQRWATSMIDVSDGLASDARHLAEESRVGIQLDLPSIPVSRAAASAGDGRSALWHALHDGEDFELLFTVPAAKEAAMAAAWRRAFTLRCTPIGRVTRRSGDIACADRQGRITPLVDSGYQHFQRKDRKP